MSRTVSEITSFLNEFAPLELGENWDNLGLLLGRKSQSVTKIMTCLTLTPDVAEEAMSESVNLIVTHHPILFKATKKITDDSPDGEMLLRLIEKQIAVYSPHTAFDSAANGINQQLAQSLGLQSIKALRASAKSDISLAESPVVGTGRVGTLPNAVSLSKFLESIKSILNLNVLQYVGCLEREVRTIGIACGSAGDLMHDAVSQNCDLFLTGESRFHTCLDARIAGICLVLVGHFASERSGVEELASIIQERFPEIESFASREESDPVRCL